MRIFVILILSLIAIPSWAQSVPEGAQEGDVVEVGGTLYEVWDGKLVPFDEDDALSEGDDTPESVSEDQDAAAPEFSSNVTGSRVDQKNTARTDVISKETIEESGARTLSDVVQRAAGIQVSSPTGTGENVTIDGLSGKYVKILIDGRPVTGQVNSQVDLSRLPINVADIERIDIVRGPMSALYGTDAMGGVINIITKRPRAQFKGQSDYLVRLDQQGIVRQGLGGFLQAGLGSFALKLKANVLLDSLRDRAQRRQSADGEPQIIFRPDGQSDSPEKRVFSLSGEARVYPNEAWSIRVYGGVTSNQVETRFSSAVPFRDHTDTLSFEVGVLLEAELAADHVLRFDTRVNRFTHRFEKLPDAGRAEVAPFCRHSEGGFFFDVPCPAEANVRSRFAQNQSRSELSYSGVLLQDAPYAKELRVAAGAVATFERAERLNDEGEDSIPGGGFRQVSGLYAELGYSPFDFLTIIPGARAEFLIPGAGAEPFAFVLAPKLAARLDLPYGFALRASYGSGFRFADFIERSLRFDHSDLGYIVEGNPDLRPESSQGVRAELANEQKFASAGVEYFANYASDFIEAIPSGRFEGSIPVFSYENLPRVFTQGINVNAALKPLYGFSADASVQVLLNAQDSSACPESNPWRCTGDEGARTLPLRPFLSGHLGLRYHVQSTGTGLFTQADFMDERIASAQLVAPGFVLLSAGMSQTLSEQFKLQVSFGNLLDAYDPTFGPKPGRHMQIALQGTF